MSELDILDMERKSNEIFALFENKETDEKIIQKARKDALYQFYKTLFLREYVTNFQETGETPLNHLETEEMKKLVYSSANRLITKPPFAFITVNPRPDVTFEQFDKLVKKFVNRKIIQKYRYVYEIRNEKFEGMHTHILVEYICRPFDLKRNCKSTFKNICMFNNPEILNIKYINESIIPDKMMYQDGEKKSEKMNAVYHTREWRVMNNIESVYESTPPFSCRGAQKTSVLSVD